MATMVACMAETPRWSVGREFGRQVVVLFFGRHIHSSCVVSKCLYSPLLSFCSPICLPTVPPPSSYQGGGTGGFVVSSWWQ